MADKPKNYKTVMFRVYLFRDQPRDGRIKGRVMLTDKRHKEQNSRPFTYLDEIPRAMRKLLREQKSRLLG